MKTVHVPPAATSRRSKAAVRRALLLPISLATAATLIAPIAAAATAPSKAIQVAVGRARAQFHNQHVHADFARLSRRDPSWALVDGTATVRDRLWAAWLHNNGKGNWELRYFDTSAPFQPQSTTRGRVPCDLYPAFSEAVCPPSGPSTSKIKAQLFTQLAPTGSAAKIGTLLKNGSYTFTFKPLVNGTLIITWYRMPKGTSAGSKPTLVARGNGDFFNRRAGKITIKLTAAGKRLLKMARPLKLTAKGTLTPILYQAVSTTRTFTLTR